MSLLLIMLRRRRKWKEKAWKRRKFYLRDIFTKQEKYGEHHNLRSDLLSGDREFYFRYPRMNSERFEHLLNLVKDKISKEKNKFRTSISPKERLLLTIRFFATGISTFLQLDIFVSLLYSVFIKAYFNQLKKIYFWW